MGAALAQKTYGVSRQMFDWRLNMSGARRQTGAGVRGIPELFAVGGVVIEDFLDEDIDEFVMTPDKYTPRAIGAFIIALAKVFSETSLPLQQQVTASSLLADLERQLESSIQNLPMLTLEEEKAARWLRPFLYHTVQSYQSLWGQEDPE